MANTPSRLSTLLLLCSVILAACASVPSGATETAIPLPTPTPQAATPTLVPTQAIIRPRHAILVSIEGGRADWLSAYAADGTMPTLAVLADQGAWGVVQGVTPTTSIVAHNSLASGSSPARTGIVGERLHRFEDSFYWYTSASDVPMTPAEPIWRAASRAGLKTAVLFWPGATPDLPEQMADYTVNYGEREAYSDLYHLDFSLASTWAGAPDSFSPAQESRFEIEGQDETLAAVFVLAIDTTDNKMVDYDTLILSKGDRQVSPDDLSISSAPGVWSSWAFDGAAGCGADFLVIGSSLSGVTLYQSGVYCLVAVPETLQAELIAGFGFPPPPPDYYALEHGWITEQDYMAMLRRQSDWMMAVTVWVYQNYQPNLLLTAQSPLKQAGHQFLLVESRQPGYSVERATTYAGYLADAASQVDDAIGQLRDALGTQIEDGETALFVVGSEGMTPIHTQINLNTLLEQAGLLSLDRRNYVRVEVSQAIAFSSGGSAWVYINLAGRDSDGIVSEEQYAVIQRQIIDLLSTLVDPATGEQVFTMVLPGDELADLELGGPYIGDIFVQARPGYLLSDERGPVQASEPVVFYGQQGYAVDLPEAQGGVVVTWAGIQPHTDLGLIRLIDVAPTLADLLGFDLSSADGDLIAALLGQ